MARKRIITMTGYYRVSTKKEAQQSSFKNQPAYFRTLLNLPEFNHYRATPKFYCDWGLSGTDFLRRTGFRAMLEDAGLKVDIIENSSIPHPNFPDKFIPQLTYITSVDPQKKPLFEEIWVKSTSRFARNINAADILMVLRRAGVFVYFIDLGLSTRNIENMQAIRKRFDSDMGYSEDLSRGRKIILQQYKEENRLMPAPYGFDYHRKTRNNTPFYTINEEESEVVKKVFAYCISGLGVKAISRKLAKEGILSSAGKPFALSSLKRILSNEKYMGLNNIGKLTTGELFEKLPTATITEGYKENLKPHEGLPIIIEPSIWYKAQEAIESRTIVNPNGRTGRPMPSHPLKDILVCGLCGNHFIYDNNSGSGYFKCATKRNKGIEGCNCNNLFVYKLNDFLKSLQTGELKAIIEVDYENTIRSLLNLTYMYFERYKNPNAFATNSKELKQLEENLNVQLAAQENLMQMLTEKKFNADTKIAFTRKMLEVEAEISNIQGQINELTTPIANIVERLKKHFEILFAEFSIFEQRKETYTTEEILNLLAEIRVFGITNNNRGGVPPQPILVPMLKPIVEATGLTKLGYDEFRYKFRNGYPDYEVPTEDFIHPLDRDDLTIEEKLQFKTKATESTWPSNTSKYFYRPAYDFGETLGVEGISTFTQLKEIALRLHQEFLEIEAQHKEVGQI